MRRELAEPWEPSTAEEHETLALARALLGREARDLRRYPHDAVALAVHDTILALARGVPVKSPGAWCMSSLRRADHEHQNDADRPRVEVLEVLARQGLEIPEVVRPLLSEALGRAREAKREAKRAKKDTASADDYDAHVARQWSCGSRGRAPTGRRA